MLCRRSAGSRLKLVLLERSWKALKAKRTAIFQLSRKITHRRCSSHLPRHRQEGFCFCHHQQEQDSRRAPSLQREKQAAAPHLPRTGTHSSLAQGHQLRVESAARGGSEKRERFSGKPLSRKSYYPSQEKKGKKKKPDRNFPTESLAQSLCNVKALRRRGETHRATAG